MLANVFILFSLHLATYFTPTYTGIFAPWSSPIFNPIGAAMHHHNAAVAAMHNHHAAVAAMHHQQHHAAATAAMLHNQSMGLAAAAAASSRYNPMTSFVQMPSSKSVQMPYVKGAPTKPKLIIPVPGHGVVSLPVKKRVSSESDSEDYISSDENESNSGVSTSDSSEDKSSALASSETTSASEEDRKRKRNKPSSSKTPEKKPLQLPDPSKCTQIKDIGTLTHPQPELPSRPRDLKITSKKKTTYKCDDDRYKGGYIIMLKTVASAQTPDKKTKLNDLVSADFYDMTGKPIIWEPKKKKPSSRK